MIEKVRIGALNYRVILTEALRQKTDLEGQICYCTNEIEIDALSEEQRQYAILLHEIIHGILEGSRNESLEKDPALLEQVVEVLAHGLLGVLRDNPDLIREIQELWNEGGGE